MDGTFDDLRVWVNDVLRPYRMNVTDFGRSWRSGLALAAIIHHIKPSLLDIDSLDERNAERNLEAAFKAAEALGIAQTLDVEDVLSSRPDHNAIATYVLQIFNVANGQRDVNDETNMAWDEDDEVDVVRNTHEMMSELFRKNSDGATSGDRVVNATTFALRLTPPRIVISPRGPRKDTDQAAAPLSPRGPGPLSPRAAEPRKLTDQRPLSPRKGTDQVVRELLEWTSVISRPFVRTPSDAHLPRGGDVDRALPPLPTSSDSPTRAHPLAASGPSLVSSNPSLRDSGPDGSRASVSIGSSRGSTAVPSLSLSSSGTRPAPRPVDAPPQRPEDRERALSPSKRGVAFNTRPAIAHAWTPPPEPKAVAGPSKSALRKAASSPDSTRVRRRSDAVFDEAPVVDPYTGEVVPRSEAISPPREDGSLATFIDLHDIARTSPRHGESEEAEEDQPVSSAHLRRPSVCGLLYKQDPEGNLIQGWKKRWFYLKGGRLFYYKEDEDTPISFISLRTVLAITMAEGKKNTLCILTPKRPYNLKASSRDEMMHWMQELRAAKESAVALEARADHKFAKEGPVTQLVGKSLKKRYAYIHGGFVCILESPSNREKKVKLPLIGAHIAALSEEQTGVKGAFEVRTDNGSALLAAESPLETDDWIMCLKQAKVIVEAQIKNVKVVRRQK